MGILLASTAISIDGFMAGPHHDGDLPTSGGQKPHLVIFSSAPDVRGSIELVGAGPIPRPVALRLTSDAAVAVDGQPQRRTISPSLRQALERRDRHC